MLSPKDQKWLDDHEDQLPQMNRGGKVGRRPILYLDQVSPERFSVIRTVQDGESSSQSTTYAAAESLFIHAVKMAGLSAIEVYVLSRRAAGLKQREIAEETGIARPNVTRMMTRILQKIKEAPGITGKEPK